MARALVQKSITAENTFSDPIKFTGYATFRLSGTWAATVKLYRSVDAGENYEVVTDEAGGELAWTVNVNAASLFEPSDDPNVVWRFGVPSGSFTSGTVVGEIRQ